MAFARQSMSRLPLVSVFLNDCGQVIFKEHEGSFEGCEQLFRRPAVAAMSPDLGNQLPLSCDDAPASDDMILCERSAIREIGHLASPLCVGGSASRLSAIDAQEGSLPMMSNNSLKKLFVPACLAQFSGDKMSHG